MPRETIHTSKYPGDRSFNVKVGWTRDLDVQIGVAEADERSMWWVFGENYTIKLGELILNAVESSNDINFTEEERMVVIGETVLNSLDSTCGSFDSLWATMDRKEINELIRILRKARDSAFGRDE